MENKKFTFVIRLDGNDREIAGFDTEQELLSLIGDFFLQSNFPEILKKDLGTIFDGKTLMDRVLNRCYDPDCEYDVMHHMPVGEFLMGKIDGYVFVFLIKEN